MPKKVHCQSAYVHSRNCMKVGGNLNVLIQLYQTICSWHPINFKKNQCNQGFVFVIILQNWQKMHFPLQIAIEIEEMFKEIMFNNDRLSRLRTPWQNGQYIKTTQNNIKHVQQQGATHTETVSVSYPTIVHYKAEARVRCVVEIAQLGKTF